MDVETLSISISSGLAGYLAKFGYDLLRAKITQKREISPNPLRVQKEPEYVERTECLSNHDKADANFDQLYQLIRDSEKRNAEWQRSVAEQLGRLTASVDALKEIKK